ncbi:MAG TPA: TlpA disulfide reductase family protein [Candidatus Dormibacteraeota bacterium]|nr:TlpA disulfide reductase family protein [Candidatus Dormibacteraeota bacterium]
MNTAARANALKPDGRRVPAWALLLPVLVVVIAMSAGIAMVVAGRSSNTVWVAAGHARVGGTTPDFSSWDLNGKQVSLSALGRRPVLLTFWATWCTVCRDELPALQRLQDQYQSGGFTVLAVNYRESSSDRMRKYLSGLGVSLQTVIDPEGAIGAAYGVDVGLPVNVLSDRSGTVAQIMIGEVPIAAIDDAVRQAVGPAPS